MMLINKLKPFKLQLIKLHTEVDPEFKTNGIFIKLILSQKVCPMIWRNNKLFHTVLQDCIFYKDKVRVCNLRNLLHNMKKLGHVGWSRHKLFVVYHHPLVVVPENKKLLRKIWYLPNLYVRPVTYTECICGTYTFKNLLYTVN